MMGALLKEVLFVYLCMYARAYILYVLGLNHCRVGCVEVKILRVNLYVYKDLCGPAPCVVWQYDVFVCMRAEMHEKE